MCFELCAWHCTRKAILHTFQQWGMKTRPIILQNQHETAEFSKKPNWLYCLKTCNVATQVLSAMQIGVMIITSQRAGLCRSRSLVRGGPNVEVLWEVWLWRFWQPILTQIFWTLSWFIFFWKKKHLGFTGTRVDWHSGTMRIKWDENVPWLDGLWDFWTPVSFMNAFSNCIQVPKLESWAPLSPAFCVRYWLGTSFAWDPISLKCIWESTQASTAGKWLDNICSKQGDPGHSALKLISCWYQGKEAHDCTSGFLHKTWEKFNAFVVQCCAVHRTFLCQSLRKKWNKKCFPSSRVLSLSFFLALLSFLPSFPVQYMVHRHESKLWSQGIFVPQNFTRGTKISNCKFGLRSLPESQIKTFLHRASHIVSKTPVIWLFTNPPFATDRIQLVQKQETGCRNPGIHPSDVFTDWEMLTHWASRHRNLTLSIPAIHQPLPPLSHSQGWRTHRSTLAILCWCLLNDKSSSCAVPRLSLNSFVHCVYIKQCHSGIWRERWRFKIDCAKW